MREATWRDWLLSDAPASRRQAAWGRRYQGWLAFRRNPLAVAGLAVAVVMLVIDDARLKSAVRWEPPHSMVRLPGFMQGSVFPHVYGPINLDSVTRVEQLVPSDSGSFKMPRPA